MSVEAAALVLAWAVIVVLAAALAACVRAIRFQEARLLTVLAQPHRLVPGDTLRLPHPLAERIPAGRPALLLFGSAECESCTRALSLLTGRRDATAGAPPILALFRGAAPADLPGREHLDVFEHQAEAFDDLNIGLLPFAVLVRGDEVLAAGAVGSADSVTRLWDEVQRSLPPTDATEHRGATR